MKCGFLNPSKSTPQRDATASPLLGSSPVSPTPARQPALPASPPSPSPETSAARRTRSMTKEKKQPGGVDDEILSEQDVSPQAAPQIRRRTTGGRKSKAKLERDEMEVD